MIVSQDYGTIYGGGVKNPTYQTFSTVYVDNTFTDTVDLSTISVPANGRSNGYYVKLQKIEGYKPLFMAYTPLTESHLIASVRTFHPDDAILAFSVFNPGTTARTIGDIKIKAVYVRNDYIED